MPNRLMITFLAGALGLAGLPALAQDLPDSGSKNFSPPADTPSYFSNENEPVSVRTADTTQRDWSAVDALAPDRPTRHPAHSDRRIIGHHGRYAVLYAPARRAGGSRGMAHAPAIARGAVNAKHARSSTAAVRRGV